MQSLSEATAIPRLRTLCQTDLYFLLRYALARADADKDWVFQRCREVQASPNGHLDLWAREHYKSTIITFALTIQDILREPEITVGIFSHTRPIAKAFLRQIKREFEANPRLLAWFPDILWRNSREAPKWSEDEGIVVRRAGNPKEATLEAWGLVDGQPTGRHFGLMVYDDVVTRESVTTPEMIAKVTEAWELSRNLSSEGGRSRYIGTRYHFNDTYRTILEREAAVPRVYAATKDGRVEGVPRLLTRARLAEKRREMGPYTFACQMLQDPRADETQGFKEDWLHFYDREPSEVARGANRYILVDAASAKKAGSDYTCLWVWALAPDGNYYWIDAVRDRLNLKQRADCLFALHRLWRPEAVGYERYGLMADVEYVQERMERENYRFDLRELGGQVAKNDRIRRLIPAFAQGRVYLPRRLLKVDSEARMLDLTRAFLDEEYRRFPLSRHDDMLDAASRIMDRDLGAAWPQPAVKAGIQPVSDPDYNPFEE
ncbi:MAG: hypothetical protein Kilf2KO_47730 [Rhodospirillales bacterium]